MNKYFIIEENSLLMPVENSDELNKDKYPTCIVGETKREALTNLAEFVKKYIFRKTLRTGNFVGDDLIYDFSYQDRLDIVKSNLNHNIPILEDYYLTFEHADLNFDIATFRVHNGTKIKYIDNKRYHCIQFYLLYDMVIDTRIDKVVTLQQYLDVIHKFNPELVFELAPDLCYSIDQGFSVTYKFDYSLLFPQ